MKLLLYKWATKDDGEGGVIIKEGNDVENYIYTTTNPIETDKGYDGYGILWWQLENYGRTAIHVKDNVGCPVYEPIRLNINSFEINLDKFEKFEQKCENIDSSTYGYTLMLNKSKEYTCTAENSNYKEETKRITSITIGKDAKKAGEGHNDVYIGKRPEFILAIHNENKNKYGNKMEKNNVNIPNGYYYVIACGGRWLCSKYSSRCKLRPQPEEDLELRILLEKD